MKKIGLAITALIFLALLNGCGGGGGSSGSSSSGGSTIDTSNITSQSQLDQLANLCAAPRTYGSVDSVSGVTYYDKQGTLTNEMAWIAGYVNFTYLWYGDVTPVSSTPYFIGATVPYEDPATNTLSSEKVTTNYQVVDAYFNSQRSTALTTTNKPKDKFHFTYTTTEWNNLSQAGSEGGFGFQLAVISGTVPRVVKVSYTTPNTPAATNNIQRGALITSVNGVDVANGSDVTTLNTGLFTPTIGTSYTFGIQDVGSTTSRTVTMTAQNITLTPVQNVGVLAAPNNQVGYMLYTDQIATAESELITAINQLKAANNGAGISDLVLDLRYNGGGYLELASELAYMIAGPSKTSGKTFEQETFNSKNPFSQTVAQSTLPFLSTAQVLSTTAGTSLPYLGLSTVYVITTSATCSASEAIMNGLQGIGVQVIQIGGTTCGKPYGFIPQDNCSTTYFTIQFKGINNAGFGDYADGFIPGGTGTTANNLKGCSAADDYTKQLGDPTENMLATALAYRANGVCPVTSTANVATPKVLREAVLSRSPARENRILRTIFN